jgi:hypothetical protein
MTKRYHMVCMPSIWGVGPALKIRYFMLKVLALCALFASVLNAQTSAPMYGLEWPGDGAVRRMLYWSNPFPIYNATYIFKVYPRKKTTGSARYYTTFFWGNNGTFTWDSGNGNTYYGAHPYPIPAPTGPGQWEISVYSNDYVTGTEVQWNRWYTQVFRAWRESSSVTHHEFYWDWPDTSKVISHTIVDPGWAARNPPSPVIVMGQTPDLNGASWGGYLGWEEFDGIISGIQIYSGLLSLSDIQNEIEAPKSSVSGLSSIWYLNVNPRPGDVADKKGIGSAHSPSWAGTTALEWTGQITPDTVAPSIAISAPLANSTVTGLTTVSAAADDNVGVVGVQFKLDGGNLGSEIVASPYSIVWNTVLATNGNHTLSAVASDGAGNQTTSSTLSVVVNNSLDLQAPTVPSGLGAIAASAYQVNLSWNTSTDNIGVTGYRVFRGGSPIGNPVANSYQDTTASASTTYSYTVAAYDAAENISGQSSTATVTTPAGPDRSAGLIAGYAADEGSGNSLWDVSGNAYTGILVNAPTWTTGKYSGALYFNGANSRVSLPSAIVFNLPFTIEAWVYPTSFAGWRAIFSKRDQPYNAFFDLGLSQNTGTVYMWTGSMTDFAYAPPLNAWTHICAVATSSSVKLYINGILNQTIGALTLGSANSASASIGSTPDNQDAFAGKIDELRIYSRALSASEVQFDMNTAITTTLAAPSNLRIVQ